MIISLNFTHLNALLDQSEKCATENLQILTGNLKELKSNRNSKRNVNFEIDI